MACGNIVQVVFVSILVDVFTEWIVDADLCCLDSAYCNSLQRIKFLDVISKSSIKNLINSQALSIERLEWVSLRNMGLSVVDLKDNFNHWDVLENILTRTKRINCLRMSSANDAAKLVHLCPNIAELTCTDVCSSSFLRDIVTSYPTLTSIKVPASFRLDLEICELIAKYCSALKILYCVCDAISCIMSKCHDLTELNCNLSVELVTSLKRGCSLTSLTVKNDDLIEWEDNTFLAIAQSCPDLRELHFNCALSEKSLMTLANCQLRLTAFTITDSKITVDFLTRLAVQQKEMTHLDLSYCEGIDDDALLALSKGFTALKLLNLYSNMLLTDFGVTAVAKACPQLEKIYLSDTRIYDESILTLLKHCPKMKSINASITNITSNCLISILKIHKDIQYLNYSANACYIFNDFYENQFDMPFTCTDFGCELIATLCPCLVTLHIENKTFNDECLQLFLNRCPLLRDLSLRGERFSPDCVRRLALSGQRWTSIALDSVRARDKEIIELVEAKPSLTFLGFSDTLITDDALRAISLSCKRLKGLRVYWNYDVSSTGICQLLFECPGLVRLSLNACHALDSAFLWEHVRLQHRFDELCLSSENMITDSDIDAYKNAVGGRILGRLFWNQDMFVPQ